MLEMVLENEQRFYFGLALDSAMDLATELLSPFGFEIVTYDYSPVPLSHDGDFIIPSVLSIRNAPEEMERLWCNDGYYQHDPVMDAARLVTRPFAWSHGGNQSVVMQNVLSEHHQPVVTYLQDTSMPSGITVPIHDRHGGLATFSVSPKGRSNGKGLERYLPAVGLLGQILHDAVIPGMKPDELRTTHLSLSSRERQCLGLCASGLSTKQIAYEISRSEPTVTLHLTSATRKLGARNRAQAVALATYYRLLESEC